MLIVFLYIKSYMRRYLLYALIVLLTCSCKGFLYHPDEIRPVATRLNATNIEKVRSLPAKNSFKFILVGDTQRFYDEMDDFIDHVNGMNDISFILINGDIVDFGLNREYNWVAEKLKKLNPPYITTIGNHDMIANGRKIYNEMFGEENFLFDYSGTRFICLNTNSREVGFDGSVPDMPWFAKQLSDDSSFRNIFVLSHVPPFSPDFDSRVEGPFRQLMKANSKTRLSMHGHNHQYKVVQPYQDGFTFLLAGAGNQRNYALVTVNGDQYSIEEKYY
jgi:3',5'-cyclic-AMP phosphodiesterase